MHDISMVQILYSATQLNQKASNLGQSEELALFERIGQRAIVTQFKNDIGICFEREGAIEFDDIGVVQFGVQLKFGCKLFVSRIYQLSVSLKNTR